VPGNAIIVLRTRAKAGPAIRLCGAGCPGAAIYTAVPYTLARGLGLPLMAASAPAVAANCAFDVAWARRRVA
jgi:hypothetical protein